jgi:hypothetical protein
LDDQQASGAPVVRLSLRREIGEVQPYETDFSKGEPF